MKARLVVGWAHESHVLICLWMNKKKKEESADGTAGRNHSWCMGPQSIIDSCVYYHKSAALARAFPLKHPTFNYLVISLRRDSNTKLLFASEIREE